MDQSNSARKLVLAALALALAASPLTASAIGYDANGPYAVIKPTWTTIAPQGFSADSLYPHWAYEMGVAGNVLVRCHADKGGLDQCAVVSESPGGFGFGDAGLALARQLQLDASPAAAAATINGYVDLPISFVLPGESSGKGAYVVEAPSLTQIKVAELASGVQSGPDRTIVLRCSVDPDGSLRGCNAALFTAGDDKAARAAIDLSSAFRLKAIDPSPRALAGLRVELAVALHDPDKPRPPARLTRPYWTSTFDPSQLAAIYPPAALSAGARAGKATVECIVARSGQLTQCGAVTEEPAGLGFGQAAAKVAGAMAMSPWTPEGEPVEGARIRVPVELQAPDTTAQPKP